MPTYTLNELLEKMEPQAQRDKALIGRCLDGLGLYAAQIAKGNRTSPKVDEMRKLVETLAGYWGLCDSDFYKNAKPLEDYLQAFDERVDEARTGGKVTGDIYQTAPNVIYGLYRYGSEMVVSQGADAMSDILDTSDLMKEIASAWDFETDVLDGLTARLEHEVQRLLEETPLPGQPVSGLANAGYAITQAVLFDNDRGFVLAHSPTAPSPYVTWQFTNEDGELNQYWGHYFGSENRAKIDYISRATEYMETYKVTERPLPTAAVEASERQDYNIIEDAADAETKANPGHGDKPSVLEQIRAAQKVPKEPRDAKPERDKKKNDPEL